MGRLSCWVGVACLVAAVTGCQSRGISSELQPITHALVSADGRSITVPALGGGCVTRVALTAVQTSVAVRLRLTTFSVTGHNVFCAADLRLLQASTRLRAPLGHRRLIDLDTGRQVPFIPATALASPRWLPATAGPPKSSPIDGWTRTYSFPPRLHRGPLSIVQNPRRFANPLEFSAESHKLTQLTIHGQPAVLWVEKQGRGIDQVRLGWHAGGYALIVASVPVIDSQRPLSPAAIIRVATHLALPTGWARTARPGDRRHRMTVTRYMQDRTSAIRHVRESLGARRP